MTDLEAPVVASKHRDDMIVSVCLGDLTTEEADLARVADLAIKLNFRFRYIEIIVVVEESLKGSLMALVHQVENVRLFTVHDGTSGYRRRVIAAEEAIGDVVMLANAAEICYLDVVYMLEHAAEHQHMVLVARHAGLINRTLDRPLIALGRLSGFKVGMRHLQTMALPRTLLNQLLSHSDPDLALRFPPRDIRVPVDLITADEEMPSLRQTGQGGQRVALLLKLMIYMAPRVLMAVTIASMLLATAGAVYALYVLGAWIVVDELAPGWLTLSAMLSVTAFFLGLSIMGLSLGLQQVLVHTKRDAFDGITSEVNRVDLFGQVSSDLNIDLDTESGADRDPKRMPR